MPCMPDSPSQPLIVRLPAAKGPADSPTSRPSGVGIPVGRRIHPSRCREPADPRGRPGPGSRLRRCGRVDDHHSGAITRKGPRWTSCYFCACCTQEALTRACSAPPAPLSESPVVDEDLLLTTCDRGPHHACCDPELQSNQSHRLPTDWRPAIRRTSGSLANLSTHRDSPSAETFLDLTAKASRNLGLRLRTEDDAANRRGRLRRSTAWPVGDDESKSLIRYRNCFEEAAEKEKKSRRFTGPLLDLGLVTVAEGKVFLTETGALFANALSPAIDESNGVDLLSDEHRNLLGGGNRPYPRRIARSRSLLERRRAHLRVPGRHRQGARRQAQRLERSTGGF